MKTIPLLLLTTFLATANTTFAQLKTAEIDALVEKTLKTFDVPGIAVAVVKDGQIIHSKGYGLRSLKAKDKVDEHTLFAIASNSKAFTGAALGLLVEEKKLDWDDKVTQYIPEFKLYNPYVTEEFTIRDLLTHRSGLGLGAGDLMIFPDSADFTMQELIHNLRYLKPVSSFRSKYDYDNLLYIVAGEIIARVAGMSWAEFIETRIFKPLEMNESAGSHRRLKTKSNVIDAHIPINGKVQAVPNDFTEIGNAAGGIYSNIHDLSKWAIMLMNGGTYASNKQLLKAETIEELWTPQTILPVRGSGGSYNTHFDMYGLGWGLQDVKGYKQVSHTGGLMGIVTQVTLIPELKLGIIVLTNQQSGGAFYAISNTIKDSYLGVKGKDRIQQFRERELNYQAEAAKVTSEVWAEINKQLANSVQPDLNAYAGTYKDNWFGEITISNTNGKLFFASKRSRKLTGELLFYKANTFVVKWYDRSLDADAYVMFGLDNQGIATSIKMKPISPMTDFSFDFQDLDFVRMETK